MKEYWVNVYEWGFGLAQSDVATSKSLAEFAEGFCLYRLHIKMDGGYNKRKNQIEIIRDSGFKNNWMG